MQEHKYKVGDRFVIEILSLPMSSDGAYYFTSGKTFYPEYVLDELPQFPNDIDEKWNKEINVGDVVTVDGGDLTFICTKDNASGDYTKCHLLASDGSVWEDREKKGLEKTGKSVNISGILKEI